MEEEKTTEGSDWRATEGFGIRYCRVCGEEYYSVGDSHQGNCPVGVAYENEFGVRFGPEEGSRYDDIPSGSVSPLEGDPEEIFGEPYDDENMPRVLYENVRRNCESALEELREAERRESGLLAGIIGRYVEALSPDRSRQNARDIVEATRAWLGTYDYTGEPIEAAHELLDETEARVRDS